MILTYVLDQFRGQVSLGWVNLRLGGCEEAIPHFEEALEISPDLLDAMLGIETCQESIGQD